MAAYNIPRATTLASGQDFVTLVTTASGVDSRLGLYEVSFFGEAGSATKTRVVFDRSTGGTTPSAPITAVPLDENSDTVGFFAYTGWAAQPTLSGNVVLHAGFEGSGGQYKWWAVPGRPIVVGTGAAVRNLSVRSLAGFVAVAMDLKIERV